MATLLIGTSKDYSGTFLFNIDTLDFTAEADATFKGSQFGGGQISTSLHIDGSFGINRIIVNTGVGGFNGANWTFAAWQATDRVVVNGSIFGETLNGTIRNDVISGNDGADKIFGDVGDDVISGGAGGDRLDGGLGLDWLSYETSAAAVSVNLATGRVLGGEATGDSIANFENVLGGLGGDTLVGDGGVNRLRGGLGADTLTGAGGADRFIFRSIAETPVGAGHDRITDFSQADGDRIDLSGIDAIARTALTKEAFHFVATGALLAAGDLHVVRGIGVTLVQGDVTGDGRADFEIALTGNIMPTAADFIL